MREPEFSEFFENEVDGTEQDVAVALPLGAPLCATMPEVQIDAAHASITPALRDELLQCILANSPAFFEQLIGDLPMAMGYGGSPKEAAVQLGRFGDADFAVEE